MSKIITYRHDRSYGYCQIKLDSGESVFLSEAVDYIKIYRVFLGAIPAGVIWKWDRVNDPKDIVLNIMNKNPNESFFDSFVKEIQKYKSIDEIKEGFGK